jgi:hypothetical protein
MTGGEQPRPALPTRFQWASGHVPTWAGRAVLGIAIFAAAAVVGTGMGLALSAVLLALGAIASRVRPPAPIPTIDLRVAQAPTTGDAWLRVWWALAAGLALVPLIRDAVWVVIPSILVAAALASLAVTGGRHWRALGAGLGVMWARLPQGLVLMPKAAARDIRWSGAGPAARGALIAAALLAIFVPLLASADAAFTQFLDDLTPDTWAIDLPVARALVLAVFTAAGGALLYARLAPPRPLARPAKLALGRLEWALPLGALVGLFAAFVAIQFTVLFGGDRHVVNTAGLTYAQYARSGFAHLLVVAALTLAVVAAAGRWARDDGRLLNVLIAALCLLTLVVLISALKRLALYEDTFGYTRLRLSAHAAILYLGALFVLVFVSRGRASWLPRAAVATTGAAVLLFALADPERRIAAHNVERYDRTGIIDPDYLASLGADAAPALKRFPCLMPEVEPSGLAGFNFAREAARRTRTDRSRAASARCDLLDPS